MKTSRSVHSLAPAAAFTMIEIALCLAIIGFALVAVIGVLPTGMGVQKANREETIINQDAALWMNAIRNGARGYDDLTNYVISITNIWTQYEVGNPIPILGPDTNWYVRTDSHVSGPVVLPAGSMALTNGLRIIGLLSTPKYTPPTNSSIFTSNYIVANIRAISGAAVEKSPQTNLNVLEDAFSYRMVVENVHYVPVDPASYDLSDAATNGMDAQHLATRINQIAITRNLRENSRDLRLSFRWPLLPNGVGNGRQQFRLLTGGQILEFQDVGNNHSLYFLQPSTYGAR